MSAHPFEGPTDWEMIQGAARGSRQHRQAFAQRYYPVVRSVVANRWRGTRLMCDIDDACQEIFAECFRANGPLLRIDRSRSAGFKPFLTGIARNIARRIEKRSYRSRSVDLDSGEPLESNAPSVSRMLDRSWAMEVIRRAEAKHHELAKASGSDALKRVELLRLRFRKDMPIREIARLWNTSPVTLHRSYRLARKEFLKALREVISCKNGQQSRTNGVDRTCRELVELLSQG